jgi:hypothetical protein
MDAVERALLKALLRYHEFLEDCEFKDVTPELVTQQYAGLADIFAELDDAQRRELAEKFTARMSPPGSRYREAERDFLERAGLVT